METNVLTIPPNTKESYVLFLDKQRAQISNVKEGKIDSFDFPQSLVRDGDIVDDSKFTIAFTQWIKSLSLPLGTVTIIISNGIYFGITLLKDENEKKESEISTFLETVPFSLIRSKQITIGTVTMEIAANKEFYDQVRFILGSCSLFVIEVLPLCTLDRVSGKRWLDNEMIQYTLAYRETLRHYNILEPEEIPMPSSSFLINKEKPMQIYVLLSIFGILIIILFYLILSRP